MQNFCYEYRKMDDFRSLAMYTYEPGRVDDCLQLAHTETEQALLKGELFQHRMEFADSEAPLKTVAENGNFYERCWAQMLLANRAAIIGDLASFGDCVFYLREQSELKGEPGQMASLMVMLIANNLSVPVAYNYETIMRMPVSCIQWRLYLVYSYAKVLLAERKFEKALALVENTYLLFARWKFPLVSGNLSLVRAIALSFLGEEKESEKAMVEACGWFCPDGLTFQLLEFSKFYSQKNLDVIGECWPMCRELIDDNWKINVTNRVIAYNHFTGKDLAFTLSKQEFKTALLAATGFSNKEIAARLDVSTHTVGTHLKNIYEKLQINDRHLLAQYILPDNL